LPPPILPGRPIDQNQGKPEVIPAPPPVIPPGPIIETVPKIDSKPQIMTSDNEAAKPSTTRNLPRHEVDAECVAFCQKMLLEGQSLCSVHIVTQTEKWGLVWRADYKRPGPESPDRVNRITCWKSPDGDFRIEFAVLQLTAPLGEAVATHGETSTEH
jgi:hypothetical protein